MGHQREVTHWDSEQEKALRICYNRTKPAVRCWKFWDKVRERFLDATGISRTYISVKRKAMKLGMSVKLRPLDKPCRRCGQPQNCRSSFNLCRPCYAKKYYASYKQIK